MRNGPPCRPSCGSSAPVPVPLRRSRSPASRPFLAKDSKTQFIAVASGKGGVGKSTVTVNLAVALAREGKKVGIIDADIYGLQRPRHDGIEQAPVVIDKTILPVERFGVKVILMAFFVRDNSPVIWRGPMLGKMLRNFFTEVHWGTSSTTCFLTCLRVPAMWLWMCTSSFPKAKKSSSPPRRRWPPSLPPGRGTWPWNTEHEILGVVENMSWYACSAWPDSGTTSSVAVEARSWPRSSERSCSSKSPWAHRTTTSMIRTSLPPFMRPTRRRDDCMPTWPAR